VKAAPRLRLGCPVACGSVLAGCCAFMFATTEQPHGHQQPRMDFGFMALFDYA
jgi:hypothetical protein